MPDSGGVANVDVPRHSGADAEQEQFQQPAVNEELKEKEKKKEKEEDDAIKERVVESVENVRKSVAEENGERRGRTTGVATGKKRMTLEERAKYAFEEDSEEDGVDEDGRFSEGSAEKRLNALGRRMADEVDSQNRNILRSPPLGWKKEDDARIPINKAWLDRIR